MHLLFHIVYAAHAGGTHDKLALDALRHLEGNSGRWRRLFLAHSGLYLEGARAPDGETGDVPRDQVSIWYTHVVEALGVEDWPTAVYCAGVLSRAVMDPLRPFQGARSGGGGNLRRDAAESLRSACLAYAGVLGGAIEKSRALAPEVGLGAATLLAAARAPGRLLARYWADAEERGAAERACGEVPAAGEVGKQLPDPRAQPASGVLLSMPRERVTQAGRMREAGRWAGGSADIIPLRRPAAPSAPASTAAPLTSSVTRQPMLYLVSSEARGGGPRNRPLDEAPRLVWRR